MAFKAFAGFSPGEKSVGYSNSRNPLSVFPHQRDNLWRFIGGQAMQGPRWPTTCLWQDVLVCLLFATLVTPRCFSQKPEPSAAELSQIAEQAYLFAYPLVLMDLTRRSMTMDGSADFVNHFGHAPFFPDEHFRQVIRPNADTLYSTCWLDLSQEPVLLHVPDTHGRYYVMQLMDAWSETISSPGKRTTGTAEGWFAIVGPGWKGKLPPGVRQIDSPTNEVWLLGRTQTNGTSDYDYVHSIQGGYQLALLSHYPQAQPPLGLFQLAALRVRATVRPPAQVERMSALEFFRLFAELLKANPAHADDGPMIQQLAKIGIRPGNSFEPETLGPEGAKAIEEGAQAASAFLRAWEKRASFGKTGWSLPAKAGRYGIDYRARALTAYYLLGGLPPEDAVYLNCRQDVQGKALAGSSRYVMHFEKNQLPAVRAFWSVTMYDDQGYFAANPIDRFAIGDRDPLKFNADGSLDLYIQHESPGPDKENNWLPAPVGEFNLALRMYWPDESIVSGRWIPPAVISPMTAK